MTERLGPAGRIGRFFIDSKLTPLLVLASLGLGALAVSLTPREEEPQIVVPIVDLFVALPGAGPKEVENRVTLPLEKRMWEIPGVEYVYSTSMPGLAMVTVRFFVGDDQERSLVKVYDQLASSLDKIPAGATPPLVKSRTIDDVPVLGLTLTSQAYDAFEIRRMAAELRRELVRLDDVAEVRLIGGEPRQVRVLLDAARLAASGLDPAAVAQALAMQNAEAPAGTFTEGNREVLVETGAFLHGADEVAGLVVGVRDGRPVRLRDVAEIVDGPGDPSSYVFLKRGAGEGAGASAPLIPAVTLTVAKRQGSDAHRVSSAVMDKLEDVRSRLLPPEIEVTVTRDYGATAKEKADELLLHLIVAIASVSILLGLFLGWRGALVVFVSVPVSFALTLFVYYIFGYTLNRVTLFALIFVTGIVVDDSIIVVENIVRHFSMRQGGAKKLSPLEAAVAAVSEVGNPTILATLTVIASVLPMAFVRGLMGPYMLPMPVGASIAMAFSLFVALIAAPWLSLRLLRDAPAHGDDLEEGGDLAKRHLESSRVYRVYRRILRPLLLHPSRGLAFLGVTFLLLLGAIALFPLKMVSVKMLPFDNKSELQVILDLPEGTTLETTTRVAREITDALAAEPEVTDIELYAGTAAPINFNGLVRHYDLRSGSNVADLQVNLLHKDERAEQSHDIAKRMRPIVQEIAARHGVAAKVVEVPPGPPVLSTLVAEVYGPTEEERIALAEEIREIFRTTAGVVDIDWMVEAPQSKRIFRVDREKAALHGVPAAQVARTLRLVTTGETAGLLHDDDELEPIAIRLELPRADRSSVEALGEVRVRSMNGALVALSELITVEETTRQTSRFRKNLQPVVYVTGDVAASGGAGGESPVYAILEMAEKIDQLETPSGAKVEQHYRNEPWSDAEPAMKWDGEWHITYEVFRDLGAAFGVVLILIYLLIIGWFGSFRVPLTMMIAIPLSLIGVLPGHWLFGAFFTATSMIGFIALAGIMVRNSVLLIDFVNLAVARGESLGEAVLEAGAVRFRPILLTAGTVVVGAFVILFDPIFQGLAIALMTGAIASTGLTLIVVPLVHFLVERGGHEKPLPEAWLSPPIPEAMTDADAPPDADEPGRRSSE